MKYKSPCNDKKTNYLKTNNTENETATFFHSDRKQQSKYE